MQSGMPGAEVEAESELPEGEVGELVLRVLVGVLAVVVAVLGDAALGVVVVVVVEALRTPVLREPSARALPLALRALLLLLLSFFSLGACFAAACVWRAGVRS
jgi:ABC-type lipoprotein release transport system permease subunit